MQATSTLMFFWEGYSSKMGMEVSTATPQAKLTTARICAQMKGDLWGTDRRRSGVGGVEGGESKWQAYGGGSYHLL